MWWIVGGVVLIAGLFVSSRILQNNDSNVIARNGMHWHPQLMIYVKGQPVEIPQNVGIGAVHAPMHTHDDLPVIHLEFQDIVKKNDIKLGRFFEIWDRDMNSFGKTMRMTVNGEESTEFGDYMMRDGDKIELRYE